MHERRGREDVAAGQALMAVSSPECVQTQRQAEGKKGRVTEREKSREGKVDFPPAGSSKSLVGPTYSGCLLLYSQEH